MESLGSNAGEVLKDCFGKNQEQVVKDLCRQVEQSLKLLNPDISSEYHEAMAMAPELVRRESPIIDFLRTEEYHTLKAAERIARFWKTRKEFFKERWLLPMTQSGAGALSPDQVQLLRTGFHVLAFSSSQVVGILDTSRLPKGASVIHPAIMFYLFCVATCEMVQTEGFWGLHIINQNHVPLPMPEAQNLIKKIRVSVPGKFSKVVVSRVFVPEENHLLDYMAFRQQRVTQNNQGQGHYVIGDSVRSTLNLLEEGGLDRACIPLALGGDFFYSQQFSEWIRARLSVEDAMTAAPPVRNSSTANYVVSQLTKRSRETTGESVSTSQRSETGDGSNVLVKRINGEKEEEFLKRRTLVYGKRSYYKKRQELDDLQTQENALKKSNAALWADNRRLEMLLAQARVIVAEHLQAQAT